MTGIKDIWREAELNISVKDWELVDYISKNQPGKDSSPLDSLKEAYN